MNGGKWLASPYGRFCLAEKPLVTTEWEIVSAPKPVLTLFGSEKIPVPAGNEDTTPPLLSRRVVTLSQLLSD
jgi:hypothetical protein